MNYNKIPEVIFKRDLYVNRAIPYIGKQLIKAFTGQRRVGKSYLLFQIMEYIQQLDAEAQILYINKEDLEFDFIKNHLGPAFKSGKINTKIIIWDHNCDLPDYPMQILADAEANQFVDGSAFHLYAGNISALSKVKEAYPNKNIYFTEQWTSKDGDFGGDLQWHIKNVIIGSLQNWSRVALEWNLANDASFGPHTPGGCTACKGALTIDGAIVTRNVPYYIIAHVSKFIPAGSVRVAHSAATTLPSVVFKTPEGKIVMLLLNDAGAAQSVNVAIGDKWVKVDIGAGTVATIIM